MRLCLYVRVTPICIPQHRPQRNGAVENFNGWFQPLLFQRQYKRPTYLRRELERLTETVNHRHIQPRLQQRTIDQYRRSKRLRKLPARFELDLHALPICEGHVVFIRWVSARETIKLLGQKFNVGRRGRLTYVKVVLDTKRQYLTVYVSGHVFKRWPYKSHLK